jgi:hypothetical protein
MNLRSFALGALGIVLCAPALAAQHTGDHGSHGAMSQALTGDLAEHFKGIGLTEAQTRQVKEIQAKAHATMDSLRHGATDPNDAALKARIARVMREEHAAFKAVLTPAQVVIFEANMKAHHEAEAKGRPA